MTNRHTFIFSMLLLAGACSMSTRTRGTRTRSEIRDLEQRIEAAVVAGDTGYLREVYADDLRFTHGPGQVSNKEELLKMVAFRPFIARIIRTENIQTSQDTAETRGTITVTRKPRPSEKGNQQYTIRYVRIYREQNGKWRLSRHTTTEESRPRPAG